MSAPDPVPPGPLLRQRALARLPLSAGRWLKTAYLKPMCFADYPQLEDSGIATGIYLITDLDKRIRWLGQASRDDDLTGRLAAHARNPFKAKVFANLRVIQLVDHTPRATIDVIEGRCADLLGLRNTMGPRRWPPADNWLQLVA